MAKEIVVYIDQNNIVDTFFDFGIILEANITHHSENTQLCQIIKQQLNNLIQKELQLVPQVNESIFTQNFINGSLKDNYVYIVSMVPIENGAFVLLSDGKLSYIEEINNTLYQIDSHYKIMIELNQLKQPIYMLYLSNNNKLVIIINRKQIYISFNKNESNIFGDYTTKIDHKILTTQNLVIVDNYVFSQGQNQFTIYSFDQDGFVEIIYNINTTQNYVDIKVHRQNDFFYIYFLHRWQGVKICTFDLKDKFFNDTQSFDALPFNGYKIELYKHIIFIVDEYQNESIITQLHQSKLLNEWSLINTFQVKYVVKDIIFTDYYATIIGNNVHDIIYHSLPTIDYKIKNQIIIPGLQKIHFINQSEPYYNLSIRGITKNTYFISKFYLSPQQISCQYNQDKKTPIQFTYQQNSTKCSKSLEQHQGSLCFFISNYTVLYQYPLMTVDKEQISFVCVVLILALICPFLISKLCWKESQQNSRQTIQSLNSTSHIQLIQIQNSNTNPQSVNNNNNISFGNSATTPQTQLEQSTMFFQNDSRIMINQNKKL